MSSEIDVAAAIAEKVTKFLDLTQTIFEPFLDENAKAGIIPEVYAEFIFGGFVKLQVTISSVLETILPLVNDINEMEFETTELTTIYLDKKAGLCGEYLKWKNHEGGWSYWLFNQKSRDVRNVRDLGYINNDYQNLENNNFIKNIGKRSFDRKQIGCINVESEKRSYLESLFDSPKVYLFMGVDFAKEETTDWLSVKLNDESFIIKDYSDRTFDINLEIELPERNTVRL